MRSPVHDGDSQDMPRQMATVLAQTGARSPFDDDQPLPTLHTRLGLFALFDALTGVAVGIVLDQVAVGISVGAACGILFGYFGAR